MTNSEPGGVARAVIAVINGYRHMVSPLRPATCRFMPTCSQYAVDALTEYGLLRGAWLAAVRLAKCGPWHNGGWDPIPERCEVVGGSQPEGRSEATGESTQELRSANV
jgi:putative membrane protein insertion efficiency factor